MSRRTDGPWLDTGIILRTSFSQSPGGSMLFENELTPVAAKDEIYLGNTTNRGTRIWTFSVTE